MQTQGHVQILVDLIDFGMNVQEAGDEARVRHEGSASPTGGAGDPDGGKVVVERYVPDSVVEALEKKGHRVSKAMHGAGFGGYQGILIDHQYGILRGATEPRKDGAAVGY